MLLKGRRNNLGKIFLAGLLGTLALLATQNSANDSLNEVLAHEFEVCSGCSTCVSGGDCVFGQVCISCGCGTGGCFPNNYCGDHLDVGCSSGTCKRCGHCYSRGAWVNQGCGPAGGCSIGTMYQTRTVDPPGCDTTSQCNPDPACNPPTCSINATPDGSNPSPVNPVTVTWSSADAISCTVTCTGPTCGPFPISALSGTQSYGPIFQTHTYTLGCSNAVGPCSASDSVLINTPAMACSFLPPSPLKFPGVGSSADPYWLERGTDFFDVKVVPSPNPGPDSNGTNFSYCRDVSPCPTCFKTCNPIEPAASYNGAIPGWQITWGDGTDAPSCGGDYGPECLLDSPDYLNQPPYYSVEASNPATGALGACYFDVLPPANATYWITARGEIKATSAQRSKNNPQGWVLPYYPEGVPPFGSTSIGAPSYDELLTKFPITNPASITEAGFSGFFQSGALNAQERRIVSTSTAIPDRFVISTGDADGTINVRAEVDFVVYFPENVRVNANIEVPSTSSVTFIVRGTGSAQDALQIAKNVTRMDGIWYVMGNINTAYDLTGVPTEITPQLIVEGALISVTGTIRFLRNLSEADNLKYPAEKIIFPARYYLNSFMGNPSLLGEATASWREITP